MAFNLLRSAVDFIARRALRSGIRRGFEEVTGEDIPGLIDVAEELLGREPETTTEARAVLEEAQARGIITEAQIMAARDPETGQFVSGSGTGSGSYRDYSVTNIMADYRVAAAELPGAFPIIETVPMGDAVQDLHHDQRAHLTQAQLHMQATVPGTLSEESTLIAVMELSLDADPALAGENLAIQEEANEIGNLDRRSRLNVDEPDVLFTQFEVNQGSFADTVNGVGGGADAKTGPVQRTYPGGGPVVDRRDNLYLHISADDFLAAAISDSAIEFTLVGLLYWRVFEE